MREIVLRGSFISIFRAVSANIPIIVIRSAILDAEESIDILEKHKEIRVHNRTCNHCKRTI